MKAGKLTVIAAVVWACSLGLVLRANDDNEHGGGSDHDLNAKLALVLRQHGFTGRIESTLEHRLGRQINRRQANLGRLLFFDNVHSLHRDNTCAGCHSPTNGMGDTQSIAIGVDNNGRVGPQSDGRAQSAPLADASINTAFFPKLMWNGRFFANARRR